MAKIDRSSIDDARNIVEKFMPEKEAREKALTFLADAIIYANGIKSDNWNLNLDKSGQQLQFNIGHEFSFYVTKQNIGVLVLKNVLKSICNPNTLGIDFVGYSNKLQISKTLDSIPDILVKVPDSVLCRSDYIKVSDILDLLEKPNREFINYAIHSTKMLPRMRQAHSPGLIAYLKEVTNRQVPNPNYSVTESDFYAEQQKREQKIKRLNEDELKEKIITAKQIVPEQVTVVSTKFKRDPHIVAYAKIKAKGICQDCLQPAPFINKSTNEPFLETHHIIPLSEGGADTVENTIALCPNCHRKRHYG